MRSDLRGPLAIAAMAIAVLSSEPGLCAESRASSESKTIADCHQIEDKPDRADCYDLVTKRSAPSSIKIKTDAPQSASVAAAASNPPRRMTGYLAHKWGYDQAPDANHLEVRLYNDNYLLFRDSSDPNVRPNSPALSSAPAIGRSRNSTVPVDVDHPELKFQVSFKARLLDIGARSFANDPDVTTRAWVDDAFGLWLGYTQQSHWQLLNSTQSSPFRESDYQPEAIVSIHPWLFVRDRDASEWNWRLFNIGVGHQSNGQSGSLSRSWNYLFAQLGFESDNPHGQWSVVLRPWYRFSESAASDDNRGLTDYIGYGDIRATWTKCDYQVSLMARGNPSTGKGAAQLDASFPLWPFSNDRFYPLQWYVQVFTGYGESLIDYNWRQTTAGIGVKLNDRAPIKC